MPPPPPLPSVREAAAPPSEREFVSRALHRAVSAGFLADSGSAEDVIGVVRHRRGQTPSRLGTPSLPLMSSASLASLMSRPERRGVHNPITGALDTDVPHVTDWQTTTSFSFRGHQQSAHAPAGFPTPSDKENAIPLKWYPGRRSQLHLQPQQQQKPQPQPQPQPDPQPRSLGRGQSWAESRLRRSRAAALRQSPPSTEALDDFLARKSRVKGRGGEITVYGDLRIPTGKPIRFQPLGTQPAPHGEPAFTPEMRRFLTGCHLRKCYSKRAIGP